MISITELDIVDLVKDSEIAKQTDVKRTFEYNLSDKAAKAKLIKGARRKPFDVVENSSSSNLIFSPGAWNHVVLAAVGYWDQVKGEKTCKIGDTVMKIASIDFGKEASGKHVDTVVVFYANRDKVVCHLYNTTQLIVVNGHGYANLIKIFLKPFFESKMSFNIEKVEEYNKQVLQTLGPKQVKRSTVKYKSGSSFPCKSCDLSARNMITLKKHKDKEHALSFNSSKPITLGLTPLKHSTRNNSISEALLQENISSTNLSKQSVTVTIDQNLFKYTCLDCNFVTTEKTEMKDHVINHHDCTGIRNLNFKCITCDCEFDGEEQYQAHVKTHDTDLKKQPQSHESVRENLFVLECKECS